MQACLDDPAGAAREAETRLAHIRTGFSIAHMTDRIEALSREALDRRRHGRDPAIQTSPLTR
jgi:hypothetical protein